MKTENYSRHGEAGHGRRSKEYITWGQLKGRCLNPKNPKYPSYGGAGITVSERWLGSGGFQRFLEDMGRCPVDKNSIDRVDNALGYSKENCRWADDAMQANNQKSNRRLTYEGQTKNLSQWARDFGLSAQTLWARIEVGWPVERALTEAVHKCGIRYSK